jgi:hypothetical protein
MLLPIIFSRKIFSALLFMKVILLLLKWFCIHLLGRKHSILFSHLAIKHPFLFVFIAYRFHVFVLLSDPNKYCWFSNVLEVLLLYSVFYLQILFCSTWTIILKKSFKRVPFYSLLRQPAPPPHIFSFLKQSCEFCSFIPNGVCDSSCCPMSKNHYLL